MVGKTSLVFRYINDKCPEEHDPTVEDVYTIKIDTEECKDKDFKILDTAGEEDYQNMLDQWISTSNAFILVFAINDKETFDALKNLVKRIEKNEVNYLPCILVGNKSDLRDQRTVSVQEAEEFAKSINAEYFETSALVDNDGNVKKVFHTCGNLIMKKINKKDKPEKKCHSCSVF